MEIQKELVTALYALTSFLILLQDSCKFSTIDTSAF